MDRSDRKRLLHVRAGSGQLLGGLLTSSTRAAPAYLAITNRDWWHQQLHQREESDLALFWRRNTNAFRALAPGGLMLHLVKNSAVSGGERQIEGFSIFNGDYEVGDARRLWHRYDRLLGVASIDELYDKLSLEPGSEIGIISLEYITEFDSPVRLSDLAAGGVPFPANIVSGRRLSIEELSVVMELAGLGVDSSFTLAAEEREPYG